MLVLENNMPKGVYPRTEKHLNAGNFKKGTIPHNKNKQCEHIKKKVERFKLGLAVECKNHGEHFKWRLHTENNVQCLHCAAKWQMDQRRRNPLKFIFRDAIRHAKAKNRIFEIVLEDLEDCLRKQNNVCALTGIEFNEINAPSLDRIDSEIGYTKENIQFIGIKINIMKSNLSEKEFIKLCVQVAEYSEAGEKKKRKKK
jgi:hypothetical protein